MQRARPHPAALVGEKPAAKPSPGGRRAYAQTVAVTVLATAVCSAMYGYFDQANLIMVYMFGVAYIALNYGKREAILGTILSVLAFDVLCTEPRGWVTKSDVQYVVTLVIMMGVAMLITTLAHRLRAEVRASAERERRAEALYRLSKELSRQRDQRELAEVAQREIESVFAGDVAILLPGASALEVAAGSLSRFEQVAAELEAAGKALARSEPNQTEGALYIPLRGSHQAEGVLAFRPKEGTSLSIFQDVEERRHLLETFANGIGIAVERARLARQSQEAMVQAEGHKTRNALLSSISHDLRTPLASIASAASAFSEGKGNAKELASAIYEESVRLNFQIQNLLDMTRLQSGEIVINLEWNSLEELVGLTIQRMRATLSGREVTAYVPPDLPMLMIDGDLVRKVILNLLENASVHTPAGTPVEITGGMDDEHVWLMVADRGPGIRRGQEVRIFERFFQSGAHPGSGVGLGLAICKTVMQLHQGSIWARNRADGPGAEFRVEFPLPTTRPEVPLG